jgi:hypothetical protein
MLASMHSRLACEMLPFRSLHVEQHSSGLFRRFLLFANVKDGGGDEELAAVKASTAPSAGLCVLVLFILSTL